MKSVLCTLLYFSISLNLNNYILSDFKTHPTATPFDCNTDDSPDLHRAMSCNHAIHWALGEWIKCAIRPTHEVRLQQVSAQLETDQLWSTVLSTTESRGMSMWTDWSRNCTEVLRGLRIFLDEERPHHHSNVACRKEEWRKEQLISFLQRILGGFCVQPDKSWETLSRLLRDGAEQAQAFLSDTLPSWLYLELKCWW